MRIVALSDIHGHFKIPVPDGDVLIVAGDICAGTGSFGELVSFNYFLKELPHKHKIVIAGNHDRPCERETPKDIQDFYITNATYLQDSEIVIDGVKFYGSPWQPWFYSWAFNLPRGKSLKDKWDLIPQDTDILITHGPPLNIFDDGKGCQDLYNRVMQLNLKLHFFGHIHEHYGVKKINDTIYANVSLCDDNYNLINEPLVIDI